MGNFIPPPDVSGVGPNWYGDSTTGVAIASITAYNTAVSATNTASVAYNTTQNNLINVMNNPASTKAQVAAARGSFNTAQAAFNTALVNQANRFNDFQNAETAARIDRDSQADAKLNNFAASLNGVMNHELTLSGTTTNNLDIQFSNANNTRIGARGNFLGALNNFNSAEINLIVSSDNLQQANDNLLLARAQLLADQKPTAASAAVLTADNNLVAFWQNQVNAQSGNIGSFTATRDADLNTFLARSSDYQSSINAQVGIINQAAQIMQVSAADFVKDLEDAQISATNLEQNAIAAAKTADALANAALYANNPNQSTEVINLLGQVQTKLAASVANNNSSSLADPLKFATQINVPALPASGKMSMSQLMQFITMVEVLLDELVREIRRTDAHVNEFRLSVYSSSGQASSDMGFVQQSYGNKLLAADTSYNDQVVKDNATNTKNAVDSIKLVLDKAGDINNVINQLNTEIDAQNSRGVSVISDLNSSIQVATDDVKLQQWADYTRYSLTGFPVLLQLGSNVDQSTIQNLLTNAQLNAASALHTQVSSEYTRLNSFIPTLSSALSARTSSESAQMFSYHTFIVGYIGSLKDGDPLIDLLTPYNIALQTVITNLDTLAQDIPSGNSALIAADQDSIQLSLNDLANARGLIPSGKLSARAQTVFNGIDTTVNDINHNASDIPIVLAFQNSVAPILTALGNLQNAIATQPGNYGFIAALRSQVDSAISGMSTSVSPLTEEAKDAVNGIYEVVQDYKETAVGIDKYTTSTITTWPAGSLPAPTQTPQMPAATQIEHLNQINSGSISIPSNLPIPGYDPQKPNAIQGLPKLPVGSDLQSLNDIIHNINHQLSPIVARLHAAGIDFNTIAPIFLRQYIAVREPSTLFDFTTFLIMILMIVLYVIEAQISQKSTNTNPPSSAFLSAAELLGKPNATGPERGAAGIGSGTGIGGANLFSASGNIAQSLTAVLNSSAFTGYIQGLIGQSGIIAGLSALGNLPTSFNNYSQFGEVLPGVEAAAPVSADKKALTAGIQALVQSATDVPALREGLLAVLKAVGPQNLDDEEIKQLLALLVFLLQLVALLVAALAVAAGGGATSIDQIVQKAFTSTEEGPLTSTVTQLRSLGVTALPEDIEPSNPTFLPTFINAINPELTPAEQNGFVAEVSTVFTNRGITLETGVSLGTAVHNAITAAPPNVSGDIRRDLNKIVQKQGDKLVSSILNDDKRRPSIATRIQATNPQAFNNLPPEKTAQIINTLNHEAPKIQGLTEHDRNTIVIGVLNGIITPEQAKGFVEQFLNEEALKTNPIVGNLLIAAIANKEAPKLGTPSVQAGDPGQLPDVVNLVANAFKALSKQTDEENFLQETLTAFAHTVRDQSDYFTKSLSLIMDPANTYVKNFSIVTRQVSGRGEGTYTGSPLMG